MSFPITVEIQIATLLDVADGVISTDKVFDAVTNEVDVVVLLVLSVAVKTCNTFPPPAAAKVLSPLRKVVASLVPVAVSLASETELSESLAVVTVLSDGTPKSKTLPSI